LESRACVRPSVKDCRSVAGQQRTAQRPIEPTPDASCCQQNAGQDLKAEGQAKLLTLSRSLRMPLTRPWSKSSVHSQGEERVGRLCGKNFDRGYSHVFAHVVGTLIAAADAQCKQQTCAASRSHQCQSAAHETPWQDPSNACKQPSGRAHGRSGVMSQRCRMCQQRTALDNARR
jgi:ferredoxin-NADP reductase